MMVYAALLLNILLLVSGQLVWKIGLEQAGGLQMDNLFQVLFSPLILIGIFIYGIATVVWLFVLSRLPLSIAYPLQSVAFIIALLAAVLLFHETIPANRWIGAMVILAGITVLSWK